MIALILSIVLPGALVVASMTRLLGCLKRRGEGLIEYVWATGYAMVSAMAAIWLAADVASIQHGALSPDRALRVIESGPALFVALGLLLVLRPVTRAIGTVVLFIASRLRAAVQSVFRGRRRK